MPPLPHHRAYGSVPRRFGGLSARQLFHGKQSQTTEASFGEGAMESFREAQPPRSLGAEDSRAGRPFGDLEPTELAIALASRLPLDPGDATQAPSDPAIQRWQLAPLAEAEVPGPTPRSSSSSTRFQSNGESGPPCGVPSRLSSNNPPSSTPAVRYPRISRRTRRSETRAATAAISRSWLTRSKNLARSMSTTNR